MPFAATPLPECWGFDTSSKLTEQGALNLSRCPLPNGNKLSFCWRYVSLDKPSPNDITPQERDAILAAGFTLLLVQHCRYPGWTAGSQNGYDWGTCAAAHAKLIEYPEGAHIALDLEGVKNSGGEVIEYVNAWCRAVIAAGYKVCLYVGYSCGLTSKQLYMLPDVHVYWKDAGPRQVDVRGFCCMQYPQINLAGVAIDPDKHQPDQLGGVLIGMTA